jgi:hypothetical protein
MIAINCTQCKQRLEMDDAFAGGVCRCQYCGTIQTVPSKAKLKSGAGSSSSSSKSGSAKPLYRKGDKSEKAPAAAAATPAGTGLDELAEIVASSGLARGSLTKKPPRPRDGGASANGAAAANGGGPPAATPFWMTRPVLIGAGTAIVVLIGLVVYLATRPGAPDTSSVSSKPPPRSAVATPDTGTDMPPNGEQAPPGKSAPKIAGPSFADVPLPSGTVVYVVDRSQANDEVLDTLKTAVYKSAQSLGPGRGFQIIFWDRPGEGIVAYPDAGVALATTTEIDKAKKRFEDVVSYGSTNLKPTIAKALAVKPAAIVLATAKGFSLEEDNVATVVAAVKGSPVKIHTIALGEGESPTLKKIAGATGGQYRELSFDQLRAYVR